MQNLLYAPFSKVEQTPDGLLVEGIATSERPDAANEIVDYDSVKAQLPDYAQWGNIREMHGKSAAGVAVEITPDDATRTVFLRALVVDTEAQKKVRTGTYKGFSIGGNATSKMIKLADGSSYVRRHVGLLSEISLVDRPANPDARFTLAKRAGGDMADDAEETPTPIPNTLSATQVSALQKLAGSLAPLQPLLKAASDPAKIVGLIQQSRNDLELAGDMQGASLLTQAIALIQQATGEAEDDAPAEEVAPDADAAIAEGEGTIAQAARTGNLKKAGATFSAANVAGIKSTAITLLGMLAQANVDGAQDALSALQGSGSSDMALAIGAEFTKAIEPVAAALLNFNMRLQQIERQPAPGGPKLRIVEKQIGGQPPAIADPIAAEITVLEKAIDDSTNPLQQTALRERLAYIQLRQGFRR